MTSIATTVIVDRRALRRRRLAGLADRRRPQRAPGDRAGAAATTSPWVYTGLAILVCFYFLSGPTQGLRSFLTTLIVAGMAAFGIHELRKQTIEEFPDADYGDVFGRTRDKVVGAVKGANIRASGASKLRLPEVRRPGGEASASEAPTATLGNGEDARLQRLERLATLREKGILTEEEFAAEKARLLAEAGS